MSNHNPTNDKTAAYDADFYEWAKEQAAALSCTPF